MRNTKETNRLQSNQPHKEEIKMKEVTTVNKGITHNFLTDREILNLLASFNIFDIDFQRHISKEIRHDICLFQEAEIKGIETGHSFKIGICTLSYPPSLQKFKDTVIWVVKDHHFSFILYDHQYKDEDALNEISSLIKEKNRSTPKIFLAEVKPYYLYPHCQVGRIYFLTEGPLNDLQNDLVNLQFNATQKEMEFWSLFPSSLFEINSKRPNGLEKSSFFFPLKKGLHGEIDWSRNGMCFTV